jgi:hypothetical protein
MDDVSASPSIFKYCNLEELYILGYNAMPTESQIMFQGNMLAASG